MSEKLSSDNGEKFERPADRYRVDPEDYPIFRQQSEEVASAHSNEKEVWGIDRTASEYVTQTASLIALMDGTAEVYGQEEEREKPDHVIYLDKSARPVSWWVNTFWEDFSDRERPKHSYLNVDRLDWLYMAGVDMDGGGYVEDPNGETHHRANFDDFLKVADNIPEETYARIRALFVDGGVETEDLEEIKKMPTILDGKNLLIVDEVSTTGTTMEIAKYILAKAIPELKSINGEIFWQGSVKALESGELQQRSVPVWYSHKTSLGRGIGERDKAFYEKRYEENPTPKTRAQKVGALAKSAYMNLAIEPGNKSRELAREIQQMHEDYRNGKILLGMPRHWDLDRFVDTMEEQGVRFAPATDKSPDTYVNMKSEIERREPVY